MNAQRWLVIMAKAPRAGLVKTRLARGIGVVEATRVYRAILDATLRRLAPDRRWRTVLAVTPHRCTNETPWPTNLAIIVQSTGDLGQRMQTIFERAPPGPAVIIGSDIPGISARDIAAAFQALGRHEAVFGPAPDGGYWLIGARRIPRVLNYFRNVRWSSRHALSDTRANVTGATATLRPLADVDDVQTYLAWRRGNM